MMRRSVVALSNLKLLGDFHIREHLLQNYEGWRVLDDPQYESAWQFWSRDPIGCVRHIDPIIDDPRLTHRQRVCRLYKWSLLELKQWITMQEAHKFNIGVKVIRARFEKYRYTTDPATCDMMVRETQKYLREQCYWHFWKKNPSDKTGPTYSATGMSHPDSAQVYDHYTNVSVMYYDDAKLHRFSSHHPMYAGSGEMSDRYGDNESVSIPWRKFALASSTLLLTYIMFWSHGLFYFMATGDIGATPETWQFDPFWTKYTEAVDDPQTLSSLAAAERVLRMRNSGSFLDNDWRRVLGVDLKVPKTISSATL